MTLLGRETELERLRELVREHPLVVVTGVPGTGRRALTHALHDHLPEGHEITFAAGPRPDVRDEHVFRLAPLRTTPAHALFRRALAAVHADAEVEERVARSLVRRADGLPLAIELAARLYASRGQEAIELTRDAALWTLLPHDPRAQTWLGELREVLGALPDEVGQALGKLALFRDAFDAPAARDLCGPEADAALDALVELGLVERRGPRFEVLRCVRWAAGIEPAGALVTKYTSAVLEAGRNPRRAPMFVGDLRALFHADESTTARAAGARLARFVGERERIDTFLRRMVALDHALDTPDIEVECAIARLHIAAGEPAVALRRLEEHAPPERCRGHACEGQRAHIAANTLRRLGRPVEALTQYDQAILTMEARGLGGELGAALSDLGGFHHEQGDVDAARDAWMRALRYVAREGDEHAEALAVGNLGLLDHEAEVFVEAERRYTRALGLHREAGNTRFEGIVAGDLGELLMTAGRPLEARRHFERSLSALHAVGDDRQWVLMSAALSFAESLSGAAEVGRERIDSVRDRAAEDLVPVVTLYALAHDLHAARLARDAGESADEERLLTQLESHVDGSGQEPDELRRAALVVRAALRRHRAASGWVVAPDASFFVSPEFGRVELRRRKVLWRLLAALLDARLDPRRASLDTSAMLRAGWPDQRTQNASARNRLHVALSSLRKLGLDPLLCGDAGGYFLDPKVALEFPTG